MKFLLSFKYSKVNAEVKYEGWSQFSWQNTYMWTVYREYLKKTVKIIELYI